MSKRSRSVSLALMSLAPVMLAACAPAPSSSSTPSKPKGPTAYETVDACVFDGNKKAECEQGFKTAQAEALANAPRFATGEECELAFENCKPVEAVAAAPAAASQASGQAVAPQQASSGFMPMMAGFMLGNALSGSSSSAGAGAVAAGFDGKRDDRRTATGSSAASNSVLYRARGGQLSQVSSAANGKPTVTPVKARTVTSAQVARAKAASAQARSTAPRSVSRSGFGGRSGGFGG